MRRDTQSPSAVLGSALRAAILYWGRFCPQQDICQCPGTTGKGSAPGIEWVETGTCSASCILDSGVTAERPNSEKNLPKWSVPRESTGSAHANLSTLKAPVRDWHHELERRRTFFR